MPEVEKAEDANLQKTINVVRKSENPHPLFVVAIVLLTIMVFYCLYVNSVKKSASGVWSNSENKEFTLCHNKWTDSVVMNDRHSGLVNGNLVIVHLNETSQIGVWLNDTIKWMNGDIWYR